jgi:uncharacterized membrane protein YeaQ/YmgE (transglycosylase-associated protein family)
MEVIDIVTAVIVGVVVGVLGRLALPGRQRIGIFVTLLIGLCAAFAGSYLARRFNVDGRAPEEFWRLRWDWIVLAVQVGLAAVGTAIAAFIAHSRVAVDASEQGSTTPSRTRV